MTTSAPCANSCGIVDLGSLASVHRSHLAQAAIVDSVESVVSPDTKHCHCHCAVMSGPSSASAAAATVPSAPLSVGEDATDTQCERVEEAPIVPVSLGAAAVDHAELAVVPVEPPEDEETEDKTAADPDAAAGRGSEGPNAVCTMDCGYCGPVETMANIYNARCPRYVCHPCNNARRAIEYQFKRKPELKTWLVEFKKRDPEQWKAKVRSCSLSVGSLDPSPGGGRGHCRQPLRAAKVLEFVNKVEQFVSVEEVSEVLWLRRGQFIAHMISVEYLSKEEAVRKWDEDSTKPSVQKHGVGSELTLAVAAPRRTVATRGKTSRTGLYLSETLASESALGTATKRLKVANLCRAPQDSVFEEVGGAAFRPGAASSSSRADDPLAFPTSVNADSAPLALAAQPSDMPWTAEDLDTALADKPLVSMLVDQQQGRPGGGAGSVGVSPVDCLVSSRSFLSVLPCETCDAMPCRHDGEPPTRR